jgi:hypothetical protein
MDDASRPTVEMIQAALNVLRANPNASNRQIMDAVPGFREGWVVKYLLLPKKAAPKKQWKRR